MSENQPPKNVINLRERRKKAGPRKTQNRFSAKQQKPTQDKNGVTWLHYLQLFLFLGVLAYLMNQCQ